MYPCHPGLHKLPASALLDFPRYEQSNLCRNSTLPGIYFTLKGQMFSQVQTCAVFFFFSLARAFSRGVCSSFCNPHTPPSGQTRPSPRAPGSMSRSAFAQVLAYPLHLCCLENISSTLFQRLFSSSLCFNVLPQRDPA